MRKLLCVLLFVFMPVIAWADEQKQSCMDVDTFAAMAVDSEFIPLLAGKLDENSRITVFLLPNSASIVTKTDLSTKTVCLVYGLSGTTINKLFLPHDKSETPL